MKKFFAIIICTFILISVFAVSAFAMEEKPYVRVINFSNNNKSYPIGDSIENATRFLEYYNITNNSASLQIKLDISGQGSYQYPSYSFIVVSNDFQLNGEFPIFSFDMKVNDDITDFAIVYIDNNFKVINYIGTEVYMYNGSPYIIDDLGTQLYNQISPNFSDFTLDKFFSLTLLDGHYVAFPRTNEERIAPSVFNSILPALGAFVGGIGSAFVNGFTSVFMTNGSINALGIFILVLLGVSLGYGVIRWITGLFRRESN